MPGVKSEADAPSVSRTFERTEGRVTSRRRPRSELGIKAAVRATPKIPSRAPRRRTPGPTASREVERQGGPIPEGERRRIARGVLVARAEGVMTIRYLYGI